MIKLALILASLSGYFQDTAGFKSDIKQISDNMKYKCYTANIQYKSFIDDKLVETSFSNILMNGDLYKITIGNLLKINGKDYNLFVDAINKIVVVSKKENVESAISNLPVLDSLLYKSHSVVLSEVDSVTKRYKIELNNCKEKSVEIDFDTRTFRLKRIWMEMSQPYIDGNLREHRRTLEILYVSFRQEQEIPKSAFSVASYITISGKNFIAASKISDYKVLDLVHNTSKTK